VNAPLRTKFASGNKFIAVERYDALGEDPHPALILLHGADGMRFKIFADRYRKVARSLATCGYNVYLPHYFHRTSTIVTNHPDMVKNFPTWTETVKDCVSFVLEQGKSAGKGVALVGFSLGASLVLAQAAQDSRIAAAVEVFGAVPDWLVSSMQNMPPLLILHGSKDWLVPVSDAHKLEGALKTNGHRYQMHIYENEGHGFSEPTNYDALTRAQAFLSEHFPASIHVSSAESGQDKESAG
jgi:carboxymethylenebutenolidase